MRGAFLALAAAGAAALAGLTLPVHAAPDGAAIYGKCAACHTKTGAGVPGVFPPLGEDFRVMAASDAGRRYLTLVVTRGVSGPIKVGGKPYAGVMPAQATLDDASVAAVLNHVGSEIAKTGPEFRPFAEAEIAGIRAGGATLSAQDVGKLHAAAGGQ
ncbi:cytochrome c [Novosphingobium sp.]|uniref:c-type cytochrome n=1 Tax=Novosphingobium sp. TaxID=1874826 RepID=UPI001DF481A1|nr:cytochrome c [Novosphingobium sp.]MBX9662051.1 cytochrome c [Novosphingobium sp.]